MQIIDFEVSKEEYERLKSEPNINKAIEDTMPIHVLCGYGYYNGRLVEENGKYYKRCMVGGSCD